jgi:hypothetical protein
MPTHQTKTGKEYKNAVEDKFGRIIEPFDVLKVFHYVSRPHRKREYMYKWVLESAEDPNYLRCHHLTEPHSSNKGWFDPRGLSKDFEIVQSKNVDKLDSKPKKGSTQ